MKLCKALGYDVNSVEFAVKDDVPYAIDFMNPVPDADVHTVGEAHFEWLVERVAELAIAKALSGPAELEARWAALLGGETAAPEKKKVGGKKSAAKTAAEKKAKAAAPRLKARAAKKVKGAKPAAESAVSAENAEAIAEMAAAVEAASPVEETQSMRLGRRSRKRLRRWRRTRSPEMTEASGPGFFALLIESGWSRPLWFCGFPSLKCENA